MAQLMPYFILQFRDSNGNPLVGGQLFTYQAGTTTPLATYTDASGSTPNANPVVLDSNGQASVWIGASAYKFVLKTAAGATLNTVDNVTWIPSGYVTSSMIANGAVGTTQIATNSITTALIQNNAITSALINAGAVDYTKLASLTEIRRSTNGQLFPQYNWTSPTLIAPATQNAATTGICFSPDSRMLVAASSHNGSTQGVTPYERGLNTFTQTAQPSMSNINGTCVAFTPNGFYCAICGSVDANNPFIELFTYNSGVLGNVNPYQLTAYAGSITSMAWSPDGSAIVFGMNVSPYLLVSSRTGINLTAVSGPASMPGSIVNGVAFSADGTMLAVATNLTPFVYLYTVSGTGPSIGFTAVSTPGTTPTGSTYAAAFSPDGNMVGFAHLTSPYVTVYQIGAGPTFSKITNPGTLPAGTGSSICFSPRSDYMAVGHSGSPYIAIYSTGTPGSNTFTYQTAPVTPLPGATVGLAWSPDGQFLAACGATNAYVNVYQTASTLGTNAIYYSKGLING